MTQPLRTRIYAAYGAGWIGGQVFRDVPALVLLPFMTLAIGVPPAIAGAAIFLPKLWVVFCDPLMGLLSDRTRSPWGRRRPYLFAGAILCGITFVLLFHVPPFESAAVRGIYVGAIYTLASTAFSIYSVPYLTLASELAKDTHENTVIMNWRQIGLGLGLLAGNAMPLWLVGQGGGGAAGYQFMAWVLGLICFVTMFTTFLGTRSVPLTEMTSTPVPIREQVRLALGNKPFIVLMAANFAQLVGGAGAYATIAMFFVYVLKKDIAFLSAFLVVLSLTVVITPPLWTRLSRQIGKLPVFALAIVLFIGTCASFAVASPDETWGLYLRSFCMAAGNCGFSLMAFSMLLDCIAYDRRFSGLNREGVFSGLWSAMDKVAFACGALIAGVLLGTFGFVEGTEGFGPQTEGAIRGIAVIFCGMPTVGAIIALALMRAYPLRAAPEATAVRA
jgi:GPH family glycoside/pentoside/hexuronide:cation symporter